MELVKVGTKIKLTQEDRDALEKVKDIIDKIYDEMREGNYLLGYVEEEVGETYYFLDAILDAEDDELVIVEE